MGIAMEGGYQAESEGEGVKGSEKGSWRRQYEMIGITGEGRVKKGWHREAEEERRG